MSEDTTLTTPPETVDNRYPEISPEPVDKRPLIWGIIFAVLLIAISLIVAIWLFRHPDKAVIVRDIVIIFLGLSTFFILILLFILIVMVAYLVLKTNDLMQLVNREIRPMLYNIQETTGTVRGTATFLSNHAAQPVIAVASSLAAVRAILRSLFRR
ncbi:MAG: hypothetical protein JXM69_13940 [Anaerolineae bacterium]|nr:hypothetical protein [Anaerolineae bacterium]